MQLWKDVLAQPKTTTTDALSHIDTHETDVDTGTVECLSGFVPAQRHVRT